MHFNFENMCFDFFVRGAQEIYPKGACQKMQQLDEDPFSPPERREKLDDLPLGELKNY